MIKSIIGFFIALVVRVLMGYLATKYTVLDGWFMWVVNAVVIVFGVVLLAFVIRKIRDAFSGIGRKDKKKNKESENSHGKDKEQD